MKRRISRRFLGLVLVGLLGVGRSASGANGLDYIQIAQSWTPKFDWTPVEKLEAMGRQASTPQVVVRWNLESPKCYFTKDDGGDRGNLHCHGHGCTLNLQERPYGRDSWSTGPKVRIIQEIHRQGAVVTLAHPARLWLNKGNFVSNWASEIAFDPGDEYVVPMAAALDR